MKILEISILKILFMTCFLSIFNFSFSEVTKSENQELMAEKTLDNSNSDRSLQDEYDDGEEVLIKIGVRKKEGYIPGIVQDGKIYLEEESLNEIIEIKNYKKNTLKEKIEVNGKRYFNLENEYENLGLKNYSFNQETMSIKVIPEWMLDYEIEEKILEKRERNIIQKKNEKEDKYKTEEWKMWTPGILGIGYTRSDGDDESNSGFIRYTNNLMYGSTSLNTTLTDSEGETEATLDYAYWERDILDNKRLLIGNTYKRANYNISDNANSITGITLGLENSWDSQIRVTQKQIVGYAPTGTTVELHENGILKDFKTVTDGQYYFDVDLNNGSRRYSIKKFLPDGQIVEENISLLASEMVLSKGKMDYYADVGVIKNKENKSTMGGEVRYGIFDDFTGIIGGFDSYDDDYNKKSFYTVGEVGIVNIPYINAPLYQNITHSNDGQNNSMTKYILGLTLGEDQINYKREDYTKLDEKFQSFTKKNNDFYYDVREIKGYNLKIGVSSREDTNNEKQKTYYGNINKSYKLFYANLGLNKTKNETTGDKETYISPGISHSVSSKNKMNKYIDTISIYSNFGEENSYGVSIGKNNAGEWDYSFTYNNNDKNTKESLGIIVSYIPGGTAKISTNIQESGNNRTMIQNTIETNVYMGIRKPKFDYTKNMGKGTVAGKVYLDRDGNGEYEENTDSIVKNSKIETYRNSTFADEEGNFVLGGLETYSPINVKISSEDDEMPYYVPPNSNEKIKLNPGGRKKMDFGYRPLVSIVSEINFGESFYREQVIEMLEEMEIEFENIRTKEKYKYEFGKDDTIIKTIPVGVYSLELAYKGNSSIKIHKSKNYLVLKETEESEIIFDVEKLDENNLVLTVKQDYKQLFASLEQLYSSVELEKNKYIGYKQQVNKRR